MLAHTTSSVVGGTGWHEATVTALSVVIGSGVFVTTNGHDTVAALKASGVKRPFLVMPPWFGDPAVKAALAYYTDHGLAPAGHLRYDPGRKWRDLPPGELYANFMGFEQEIEPLHAQIRAACPADADGVLIGGTGFRCIGILDALERDLARPVISANQASLWHCLRRSGVKEPERATAGCWNCRKPWRAVEEVFQGRAMMVTSSPLWKHISPSSDPSSCRSASRIQAWSISSLPSQVNSTASPSQNTVNDAHDLAKANSPADLAEEDVATARPLSRGVRPRSRPSRRCATLPCTLMLAPPAAGRRIRL